MGTRKQKSKRNREPQISANSTRREARKRAEQGVVHMMVVSYLESKTRGMMTHHSLQPDFFVFEDAASLTLYFLARQLYN